MLFKITVLIPVYKKPAIDFKLSGAIGKRSAH